MRKFDEIAQRTEGRVDTVIIADVVAVVLAGRRLKGHQPYRSDAEPMQIIEPAHEALKISNAVSIGIHVSADGETIYDGVFVPEVIDHRTREPTEPVPPAL